MTVPIDGIIQASWITAAPNTSRILNVWHFKLGGSVGAAEGAITTAGLVAIANMYNTLESHFDPEMEAPFVFFDYMDWDPIHQQWSVVYNIGSGYTAGWAPAGTGDTMPPGVSLTANYIPIYRKHQGRKYLGVFTETDNHDGGYATAGMVAAGVDFTEETLGVQFVVTIGDNYLEHVILNRRDNLYYFPISSWVPAQWSYQRRRKVNYGV